MKRRLAALLALWLLAPGPAARGAEGRIGGYLKLQPAQARHRPDDLAAAFGDRYPTDLSGDLRLLAEARSGPWEWAVHYEVLALAGDTPAAARAAARAGSAPPGGALLPEDERRAVDLTRRLTGDDHVAAVHRLDRLYVGYAAERLVLRLGRQAVTWGEGLVFHPMDLVNPFPPAAVDTEYKAGDDMAYAQWLLPGGADLQAVIVPRRDPDGADLEAGESTLALKFHGFLAGAGVDLLYARRHGEDVAGAGWAVALGGAVWRGAFTLTRLRRGTTAGALVTNLDRSWTWLGRNVHGFAEYYRDGLGQVHVRPATQDPALAGRLERGETFTLGRDYLAAGLDVEATPLFHLLPSAIWNLGDGSGLLLGWFRYDWREDLVLTGGLTLAVGPGGTEFGGWRPRPGAPLAAPGQAAWLRAAWYF
ncbi:hypothetical protein G3N55_07135 [Dissulfurirhabdus thermomarina]|uniref:Alginate export domain-containing protein n=1 Tax=Dissulfurirhabdus thermomarina TaxID=1765737 RepID=A0A6N9TVW2_DISTH|nr:hypothetical protein [Dissulfurirhabdus thermomarina]NDY42616.1 hypothetical protein [Dissulfurirhabdus thermomarina]NMX24073.1 hypothetical protein [Dissulfurirhabdus thermomarina]